VVSFKVLFPKFPELTERVQNSLSPSENELFRTSYVVLIPKFSIVVVVLCVLLSSYVYFLYYVVCIAVFTLDAGLLAGNQYPEVPATGHLDTGFSWFPCT